MSKNRYKWDDSSVNEVTRNIKEGVDDVPYLNRSFEWQYSPHILDYLKAVKARRIIGTLIYWRLPDGTDISTQNDAGIPNIKPQRVALDGGNRIRLLWSMRYGLPIPSSKAKNIRNHGVKVAYNPITDTFLAASNKEVKQHPDEWLTDFPFIWSITSVDDIKAHARTITKEYLNTLDQPIVGNLSTKDKETIADNVEELVEMVFSDLHYAELPTDITLEEALETFYNLNNSGIKVSVMRTVMSLVFGHNDNLGMDIKRFVTFTRKTKVPMEDDALLIVCLGVVTKNIKKNLKLLDLLPESFDKFKVAVRYAIKKDNYKDFVNNVVKASGYVGKKMTKANSSMIIPYIYTLYVEARLNHGVAKEDLYSILRKLFFSVGFLKRKFSDNITDFLLINFFNKVKYFEGPQDCLDALHAMYEKVKEANIGEENKVLVAGLKEAEGKNDRYMSAIVATQVVRDAKVLFSKDLSLRHNINSLQKHHMFPFEFGYYDSSVNGALLNKVMNLALVEKPVNNKISKLEPRSYFKAELEKNKDREVVLNNYGLTMDWADTVPIYNQIIEMYEDRAIRLADLIVDTIESL